MHGTLDKKTELHLLAHSMLKTIYFILERNIYSVSETYELKEQI